MTAAAVPLIDRLTRAHNRKEFSCGVAALDRYLQTQARQDADKCVAAAFALTEPPATRVLGYYTLSSASILLDDLPATLHKKLPRYPELSVTLLGRLAVDQSAKGRGFGEFLLLDALRRSLAAADDIGAMVIIVDAKDESAAKFYDRYGFRPLPEYARRMFLPMSTVAELFK